MKTKTIVLKKGRKERKGKTTEKEINTRVVLLFSLQSYLVDPASNICSFQRLKPCKSKNKGLYPESAYGSLQQIELKWKMVL